MKKIQVSIICNTYNQEKYIADAIDSFLMQKTDFDFEILIHDDASTDNTAQIIKKYHEKYPNIVKPIYEEENQYSKKNGVIARLQYGRAKGKYIAFCEGDDYWIDEKKLQKQFDLMERHPEINMCAHGAYMVNAETKKIKGKIAPANEFRIITVEEVIDGGGGFFATNTLFYRTKILNNQPDFRVKHKSDYSLQIYGALDNGILYLPEIMSAYRVMATGSWSEKMKKDIKKRIEFDYNIIDMLEGVNIFTNNKYKDTINAVLLKMEYKRLDMTGNFSAMLEKKYADINSRLSIKDRCKLRIYVLFPYLAKIKRNTLN